MKKSALLFCLIAFNLLMSTVAQASGQATMSNYQRILEQNLDLSSEDVAAVAERSEAYWKKESSLQDPILLMGKLDLATLRDLNLLSSELWKKLVQCNEGNANSVRLNIISMKELCQNKDLGPELEKSFAELAVNFQSYLISLPPLVASTSSLHVNGAHKLYHLHPLLVQFLISFKAIFMNHILEERSRLSEVLDQMSFKHGSANFRELISRNLPKTILESQSQKTKIDHYAIFNLYINSLALLRYLAPAADEKANSCAVYGLWPMMNRMLLYQTNLWSHTDTNAERHLFDLEKRTEFHCGQIIRITPNKGAEYYANAGFSHLYLMKQFYMKWLGHLWVN